MPRLEPPLVAGEAWAACGGRETRPTGARAVL